MSETVCQIFRRKWEQTKCYAGRNKIFSSANIHQFGLLKYFLSEIMSVRLSVICVSALYYMHRVSVLLCAIWPCLLQLNLEGELKLNVIEISDFFLSFLKIWERDPSRNAFGSAPKEWPFGTPICQPLKKLQTADGVCLKASFLFCCLQHQTVPGSLADSRQLFSMFCGEGQIPPQWPSFFFSYLGVMMGQVEGFVEVRASAIAFTSSEMGSSKMFCTTSWRAGAGVGLSRCFWVLIAARPSAYICRVIDPCCRRAVSSLIAATSIMIYVDITNNKCISNMKFFLWPTPNLLAISNNIFYF